MRYTFTQLKDLPETPAGTVSRCNGVGRRTDWGDSRNGYPTKDCYEIVLPDRVGTMTEPFIGESLYDNPEWFRRDIDFDRLTDLKCPVCGETRASVHVDAKRVGDREDGYHNTADILLEYPCGHPSRAL